MVLYGERDITCVYFPHIKLKTDNTAILLDKNKDQMFRGSMHVNKRLLYDNNNY